MNDVSQSAASQHVQDLERALGTILLDRSTRPLVVTAAGQLYNDFCRDILRRKEEFEVTLDRLKQDVEGTVRVASIYSVGLSEMAQLENEFSRRQPRAHLEVEYLRPEKVYSSVLAFEATKDPKYFADVRDGIKQLEDSVRKDPDGYYWEAPGHKVDYSYATGLAGIGDFLVMLYTNGSLNMMGMLGFGDDL